MEFPLVPTSLGFYMHNTHCVSLACGGRFHFPSYMVQIKVYLIKGVLFTTVEKSSCPSTLLKAENVERILYREERKRGVDCGIHGWLPCE